MNKQAEKTILGDIQMGVGTWAWGDKVLWKFGSDYGEKEIEEAFLLSINNGMILFDTAEVYGKGKSEENLGRLVKRHKSKVIIASKFMPYPWRISTQEYWKALNLSLERLGISQIDLYQVHWPFPPRRVEVWVECMAQAVQKGLIKSVGVSNFNIDQMERAVGVLAKHDIPLTSNQVRYNLLDRKVETSGLLERCHDLGVKLIAYSPLAQGALTGRYDALHLPVGIRRTRYSDSFLKRLGSLVKNITEIGEAHGGKTPSQVALNWLICKGAIPIPGAKNSKQAEENLGALGWMLTKDDIHLLEEINKE